MTIRFYLVRHGRAEARHPRGDIARRLLPAGRAAFAAHARALASELGLMRILTSRFARARETAGLLADATEPGGASSSRPAAIDADENGFRLAWVRAPG